MEKSKKKNLLLYIYKNLREQTAQHFPLIIRDLEFPSLQESIWVLLSHNSWKHSIFAKEVQRQDIQSSFFHIDPIGYNIELSEQYNKEILVSLLLRFSSCSTELTFK